MSIALRDANSSTFNQADFTDSSGSKVPYFATSPEAPATIGQGAFIAVPAGSTNGTAIGTKPTGCTGVKFYLTGSQSVTYTIAASAPGAAPTLLNTISESTVGRVFYEELSGNAQVYITAISGAPVFRFV